MLSPVTSRSQVGDWLIQLIMLVRVCVNRTRSYKFLMKLSSTMNSSDYRTMKGRLL